MSPDMCASIGRVREPHAWFRAATFFPAWLASAVSRCDWNTARVSTPAGSISREICKQDAGEHYWCSPYWGVRTALFFFFCFWGYERGGAFCRVRARAILFEACARMDTARWVNGNDLGVDGENDEGSGWMGARVLGRDRCRIAGRNAVIPGSCWVRIPPSAVDFSPRGVFSHHAFVFELIAGGGRIHMSKGLRKN